MKMKEKWFQLPLLGYVQRIGFYAFLIHSSTLSEVVFCTTSAYLSPCTRVYVRGKSEWQDLSDSYRVISYDYTDS